jgi:hypothetical protein
MKERFTHVLKMIEVNPEELKIIFDSFKNNSNMLGANSEVTIKEVHMAGECYPPTCWEYAPILIQYMKEEHRVYFGDMPICSLEIHESPIVDCCTPEQVGTLMQLTVKYDSPAIDQWEKRTLNRTRLIDIEKYVNYALKSAYDTVLSNT